MKKITAAAPVKKSEYRVRLDKKAEAEKVFTTKVEIEATNRLNQFIEEQRAIRAKLTQSSVIGQVRMAMQRENLLAMFCGFILGGFVPIATFLVAHYDLPSLMSDPRPLWLQPKVLEALLVLGGLVFSAKTCIAWTHQAFSDRAKAIGWVVLLEGVMILSPIENLSLAGLAILVLVNGIATGCNLALRATATPLDA